MREWPTFCSNALNLHRKCVAILWQSWKVLNGSLKKLVFLTHRKRKKYSFTICFVREKWCFRSRGNYVQNSFSHLVVWMELSQKLVFRTSRRWKLKVLRFVLWVKISAFLNLRYLGKFVQNSSSHLVARMKLSQKSVFHGHRETEKLKFHELFCAWKFVSRILYLKFAIC